MIIEQNKFFEGLDFEEVEFENKIEKIKCFKGKNGGYYRVDYFGTAYVIEHAENEDEAKMNIFEDADIYDDSMPDDEIIKTIRSDLKKNVK